jgi:uncharacterized Zn-binding protein involved in type VI secretion
MPPAARILDPTAHGPPLTGAGSPTVFIGGLPAWRALADVHTCPLVTGTVPHVGGPVLAGSTTVMIEGFPAVRLGDSIVESGPPNTVTGGEPSVQIG